MVITDWSTAQGIAVDRTVRRPWTGFALAGLHTARAKSITKSALRLAHRLEVVIDCPVGDLLAHLGTSDVCAAEVDA